MEKLKIYELVSKDIYPGGRPDDESFGFFSTMKKAQMAKSHVIAAIKPSSLDEFKDMHQEYIDSFIIIEHPLDHSFENF